MRPFVAATAVALQENPAVNAVIDDGHIVYRDYVDISIAVSSPTGLVSPCRANPDPTYPQPYLVVAVLVADGEVAGRLVHVAHPPREDAVP